MQYCTLECQQADWQFHKVLCKTFADFSERPNPDVRRAIYFPEHGDKPYFIWLPVETKHASYGFTQGPVKERSAPISQEGFESNVRPDELGVPEDNHTDCCLPTSDNPVGSWMIDTMAAMLVCGKLRAGELLNHTIMMMVRRDNEKLEPNHCVRRLAKQDVDPVFRRGPLLMLGMNKATLPKITVDLDTTALTLGLDAVIALAPAGETPKHAWKVGAVKANSTPPFFEQLEIPKRHPAFKSGETSKVTALLGWRLRTWYYPSSTGAETGSTSSASNTETPEYDAGIFRLDVDPDSPDFGRIPPAVQADKRSMLVVRPSGSSYDVGYVVDEVAIIGKCIQDKAVPRLSSAQSGTPVERVIKVKADSDETWRQLKKQMDLEDKLKKIGLSVEDVEEQRKKAGADHVVVMY